MLKPSDLQILLKLSIHAPIQYTTEFERAYAAAKPKMDAIIAEAESKIRSTLGSRLPT